MSRQQPPWRRVFDRVERKIGEPLEGVATSNKFVDVMATGMKAKRTVTGSAGWLVGGALRKVLHAVNIATLSDVKRLNGHLSELATELRAAPQPRALPKPEPAAASTRSTKKTAQKTAKKAPSAAARKTAKKPAQSTAKTAPQKVAKKTPGPKGAETRPSPGAETTGPRRTPRAVKRNG